MIKTNSYTPIRKMPTAQEIDQQVKDAAKAMEGKFLEEMMKQMRSTVQDSEGFIPTTQAEKIFREQLDQKYVSQWSDKGGLGLADMIYQQIMDKYGEKLGLRAPQMKPQGPLPLHSNPKGIKIQNSPEIKADSQNSNKTSFMFDLQKAAVDLQDPSSNQVLAPWSGSVAQIKDMGTQEYLMDLNHENGATSRIVFKGQPQVSQGQEVQAGQKIGLFSPEAKSLFWTIDVGGSV